MLPMHRRIALLALPLLLAACSGAGMPTRDASKNDNLKNPLYAEFYYDDLTETMVSLALRQDPLLEDPDVRAVVDRTRTRSLEHAKLAVKAQNKGFRGGFIGDRDLVTGDALLLDEVLYLGPSFNSAPGPALTLYLTRAIDPRDVEFPDETAVRLGEVKNQYGAHSYAVPGGANETASGSMLRTVVLWDDDLKMLYGFAQLERLTPVE